MATIEIGYNEARCRSCKKPAYINETGHYTVPPANHGGCGEKWDSVVVIYTFPYEAGTKADIIRTLIERWPVLSCVSTEPTSADCMGWFKEPYGRWTILREKRNGKFFERSEAQAEAVPTLPE